MLRSCAVAVSVIAIATFCAAQSNERITVKELMIKGGDALSSSQLRDAKAALEGKTGMMESLMDTARESLTASLKTDCYLRPDVELLSAYPNDSPKGVVMYVTVKDGLRYTLGNFRVQWDQIVSTQQLAQILPLDAMRRGDCRGLNDVESTVAQFCREHGYPNAKVKSLVQPSAATRQFDLTLYIDAGSRAR